MLDIASGQPVLQPGAKDQPGAEKPTFFFWDTDVYSRDGARGIAFPTYPPGSFDQPVVVDVASGKILYRAESTGIWISLSPDGTRLAQLIDQEPPGSEKHDYILQVTDVDSGQQIAEGPLDSKYPPGTFRFSPDGEYLLVEQFPRLIVYRAADGRKISSRSFPPTGNMPSWFSPDGSKIATIGLQIFIWPWQPEDVAAQVCQRLHPTLSPEDWRTYFGSQSPVELCDR